MERVAINPWEPAIAMEAMRLNAGLPLYESGHATHMYGPLLTVALAGVFRVAGLNLLAARMTMSILSFALAVFLSAILCRDRLWPWLGFAVLLLLGINFRTNLIFLSALPDCVAALFGVVIESVAPSWQAHWQGRRVAGVSADRPRSCLRAEPC